jgi:hypothetical protein
MAPKGSELNCPDGMCATGGSVANPLNTVEQVLTLASSKNFKDKAVSIVAANGRYDWGGDLGQKRIDLPKHITHIICNEGLATFGRADDRRVIGLKNHPLLTAFGLVLHADIEANSDEGESVLNKVAGQLFGKYIVKAEQKGKLTVTLDNIKQVIEREHLRDDTWDNEAHVKDSANLIMKIKNSNKTSLFGKALFMAKGDGMLDASTKDGMIEGCGRSSFCEEKSKVRHSSKGMKFLMRARELLGARSTDGSQFVTAALKEGAQYELIDSDNIYMPPVNPAEQIVSVYSVKSSAEETARVNPLRTPMFSHKRLRNEYILEEGTQLDDVNANVGNVSIDDRGLIAAAKGSGILSSFQVRGNAEVSTKDTGSVYTAPARHLVKSGSGDARWEDKANEVAYTIAGSLEEYTGNFQFRENNTGNTIRCDPETGYYIEQKVSDAAKVFLTNHEPDEDVYIAKGRDSIYNFLQDGEGTVFEQKDTGGNRKFNIRAADMIEKGEVAEMVAIRQTYKDGRSKNSRRGTYRQFNSDARKSGVAVQVVGLSQKFSGKGKHIENGDDDKAEFNGFGSDDIINVMEGKDNSVLREFINNQTVTTDSKANLPSIVKKFSDDAQFTRLGRNNNYDTVDNVLNTLSTAVIDLTETGAKAEAIKLGAAGTGGIKTTLSNSQIAQLIAKGSVITQLESIQAESVDFEGGDHNIASSVIDKVKSNGTNLKTAFSRFNELKTDGGFISTRYGTVTGVTSHTSTDTEHLFSEFKDKVELKHPNIAKIMNFRSSQSSYQGDPTNQDGAAIEASGVSGAKISANIGAVQSGKQTLIEERDGADVKATVGQLADPPTAKQPLKYKVSQLIQRPNESQIVQLAD